MSSRRPLPASGSSRPPSSRQVSSSSNNRMDPPPAPSSSKIARPASALSLSSSTSARGEDDERKRAKLTNGTAGPHARGGAKDRTSFAVGGAGAGGGSRKDAKEKEEGEDVNIEVVVRCRGRSEKEKAENSPMIVTTLGTITTSVSIETGPLATVVPSLTAPPASRTYHFDQVFSPEADQEILFDSVVKGTLDEVIEGYNCTLFAYGQTGTGKTYTMQGDLAFNSVGEPSSDAGIIPRTLHRLFTLLDASGSEYSVKISFVELYNEEIRDLLSSSPHADSHLHHTQGLSGGGGGGVGMGGPVGGVAGLAAGGVGGLKIFEDAKAKGGRGVWIEGLEECLVRNTRDGLKLLRLGSRRRETGETLMNKVSSRSHSIFSVTIHMKESSPTGDDLLKVGKLNLVDLAGSEDISRSGAVDKRAAEAGNINKSLLTLGRVINALVEKGKHIPYRDSNLTRLLKDSLGGGTKTRIIATISPSASNREETLSTLDYATRATRITNKPEINQRMTKGVLIKEYVMEIERLKADLLASREKNGVFLSQETWSDLDQESRLRETQVAEAKSRELILSTKITRLETELVTLTDRFKQSETDLRVTREELVVKEGELEVKQVELVGVKGELEVEKVVADVYERGEERLDGIAGVLKTVAKESLGDLDGVFGKLGRKSRVETANASMISAYATSTSSSTKNQIATLQEYHAAQTELSADMVASLEQARAVELKKLQNIQQTLSTYLATVSERTTVLSTNATDETKERTTFFALVEAFRSSVQVLLKISGAGLRDTLTQSADELVCLVEEKLMTIAALLHSTVAAVDSPISHITSALADESAKNATFVESSGNDYEEMRERLAALEKSIAAVPAKRHLARLDLKTQLTEAVASIFSAFEETQAAQDAADLARFEAERAKVVEALTQHQTETARRVEELNSVFSGLGVTLREMKNVMSSIAERGPTEIQTVTEGLQTGLVELRETASTSMTAMMNQVESTSKQLAEASTKSAAKSTKLSKKRESTLASLVASSNSADKEIQQDLEGLRICSDESTQQLLASHQTSTRVLDSYYVISSTALNELGSSTQSLITNRLLSDIPTGSTPRKRTWDVPESWERSGPRSVVIARYQRGEIQDGEQRRSMVSQFESVEGDEDDLEATAARTSLGTSHSTLGESASSQNELGAHLPEAEVDEDGILSPTFSSSSSPVLEIRCPSPPPPTSRLSPSLSSSSQSLSASAILAPIQPLGPPPSANLRRSTSARSVSSSSNAENAPPTLQSSQKPTSGKGRAPPRDRSNATGNHGSNNIEPLAETRTNLLRSTSQRGNRRG